MRKTARKCIFLASAALCLFTTQAVFAAGASLTIADVTVSDKSESIAMTDPTFADNTITSNITLNSTDDYIEFNVSLKNNDSRKYRISSISDNYDGNYIDIEYQYSDDYIESNNTGSFKAKIIYKTQLINQDELSLDKITITLSLLGEDGSEAIITINPATNDNLPVLIIISGLSITGLIVCMTSGKRKYKVLGVTTLIIGASLIPLSIYAEEQYNATVLLNNIVIKGKFESYTVAFNTDGGTEIASETITYGQKVARPATNPTKEGSSFIDWYADPGHTSIFDFDDTPITDDTTIYASYISLCELFATSSWDTIRNNLVNDPSYYPIGCEKEVALDMDDNGEDESYTVRLANTSSPEVCGTEGYSQTACGIVIEFIDTVGSRRMNPTNTNNGGWAATELITYLNSDFYSKLPNDLKAVIIPTYPIVSSTGNDGTSPNITNEDTNKNKVYLFSAMEVNVKWMNDDKKDLLTDTRILDIYESCSGSNRCESRIKTNPKNNSNVYWWLRTAKSGYNEFMTAPNDGVSLSSMPSSSNYVGVAPAFRIGMMPTFAVSFETYGGTTISTQTVSYGETATRPENGPTKTKSFTFLDWYADEPHNTVFDFANTPITHDTTIYADYFDSCNGFSTDSWNTIVQNIASNPDYYPVGCEKDIYLSNYSYPHTVRLSNTSTPEVCSNEGYSQTACGTVIEFAGPVGSQRDTRTMNNSATNNGGWARSQMATWLNSSFYNTLPEDLRTVIIPTYPIVSGSGPNGNSPDVTAADTSINKLYLLSSREVNLPVDQWTRDNKNDVNTDTRPLDYYEINNTNAARVKRTRSGDTIDWWLRTADNGYANMFRLVTESGTAGTVTAVADCSVSPAFRIGTN